MLKGASPLDRTQEEAKFQATMLASAKWYVNRGWAVFPVHVPLAGGRCSCGDAECEDAGKHPRSPRGFKDASKDIKQLEAWWGEDAPLSNIGIATGLVSGITVIDIDIGPGKAGAETWAELIADGGEPVTLTATTGSGGSHLYFLYYSGLKTAANVLGPGIDVRNDGGYVVAPPSWHRCGAQYAWEDVDEKLAPLPSNLTKKKERRGRPRKDDLSRIKWTLPEVVSMLEAIPADDRDDWLNFGIILGRTFDRSDEAWTAYAEWAATSEGGKKRGDDERMREAFYDRSQQDAESMLTIASVVSKAIEHGWAPSSVGDLPPSDFLYFAPANDYIYLFTSAHWPPPSIDRVCAPINLNGKIVKASDYIAKTAKVTTITSDPNIEVAYVKDYDCIEGLMVRKEGSACYNAYRRTDWERFKEGDAALARPYVDHVKRCFPVGPPKPGQSSDADQLLDYLAHRVQRPGVKPRFALFLAGEPGTGKDTCIEMAIPALGGDCNMGEISPKQLESGFNEHEAKTLVRISETANLQELSKWAFNEVTKVLIAGNPDTSTINPKYGRKFSVRKYCGVILTTNHLNSGVYIPPGDRRYDVLASATLAEMGLGELGSDDFKAYFNGLYKWFNEEGGMAHVAVFLRDRDISNFDPNLGQRKTAAHMDVVSSGMKSDEWLADALEELGNPNTVRADWIMDVAEASDSDNKRTEVKRKMNSALSRAGYSVHRNPRFDDGRWSVKSSMGKQRKTTLYVKDPSLGIDLTILDQERF